LGGVRGADGVDSPGVAELIASATVANIHLKVAGLHYCAHRGWDYPWPDVLALLERPFDVYGPQRLVWGSDFPAGTRFATFQQSLEVVRTHCRFLRPDDLRLILGGNLQALLATRQPTTWR
jgi:predicted TIM-barrel fold metal-dependent hydrolase